MKVRKIKGFTLIELMLVVAIIAIISALAYPNYQEYVAKSRRAEAQSSLLSLANAMERHFTTNGTYLGAAAGGADTGTPANFDAAIGGPPAYYNVTITAATVTTYTLQAAVAGLMTNDGCGNLTLTSAGVRGRSGTLPLNVCWR